MRWFGMYMNECIDSTIGHIHVCVTVLLASDDPRTSWSFQIPLPQSPLWLIFLVRLGGYIVNSLDYYSYRFIGKLTAFLQLQESILRNPPVDYSTSAERRSRPPWKTKSVVPSTRLKLYVLHFENIHFFLWFDDTCQGKVYRLLLSQIASDGCPIIPFCSVEHGLQDHTLLPVATPAPRQTYLPSSHPPPSLFS